MIQLSCYFGASCMMYRAGLESNESDKTRGQTTSALYDTTNYGERANHPLDHSS